MSVTKQKEPKPPWLLLVFSLARKGASLRVTVWRKLQRYGALPLGNSGYFLPNTEENRERFEWLATAVRTEGGEASVLEVQSIDNCSFAQMKQRFSDARAGDYRKLLKDFGSSDFFKSVFADHPPPPAFPRHRLHRLFRQSAS